MSATPENKNDSVSTLISAVIDDVEVFVPSGTSILHAAKRNNFV